MSSVEANASTLSDWVIEKQGTHEKYRLRMGVNSIGRHSSSDLRIDSVHVSRHHAEITVSEINGSHIELRDLNSINGTFINHFFYRACTADLYEGYEVSFGAQYDEDEGPASDSPIYILKYQPLHVPATQPPSTGVNNALNIPEIVISSDDEDDMKPVIQQPPEKIAVSNILTIFGNVDQTILSGLQRINPIVCEAVKQTSNTEVFELSSDEDNTMDTARKSKCQNAAMSSCGLSKRIDRFEDVEDQLFNSDSNGSSCDDNQIIYSQVLLNEMKSEMLEETDESDIQLAYKDTGQSTSNREPFCIPTIILSDEDDNDGDNNSKIDKNSDSDEDLEQKVTNWTNLLFSSQIYPKTNKQTCSIICERSSDIHGSDDELLQLINDQNAGTATKENSIIKNLFQSLEEKLNAITTDDEKSNKVKNGQSLQSNGIEMGSPVIPQSDESNESDKSDVEGENQSPKQFIKETDRGQSLQSNGIEMGSPVVKNKKRKVLRIPPSDESNESDKSDVEGENQSPKQFIKETDRGPFVNARKKEKSNVPKYQRPTLISPPHLKYGREVSTTVSLKKTNAKFLKKRRKTLDNLKELRKERLRNIFENTVKNTAENCEQKALNEKERKAATKVKNTAQNRGNFLCEMDETSTSINTLKNNERSNDHPSTVRVPNLKTEPLLKVVPLTLFSDKCLREVKNVIRKNAEQARKRSAPKKLRFSDVEKCYEEQRKIEEKTKELTSKLNNGTTSAALTSEKSAQLITIATPPIDIPAPDGDTSDQDEIVVAKKPKKVVRFNDTPTTYYFESHCEFSRKVDRKDLMLRLSYRQRRNFIRRAFPTIDRTDNIISLILAYSNEWLLAPTPSALPVPVNMTQVPSTFNSFEHYKQIVFPLMKLEYMSILTREMQVNAKAEPCNVILDHIIEAKERTTLVVKYANNDGKQSYLKKIDLVLLQIGEQKTKVFAYMVCNRKYGTLADRFNSKLFLEIIPNSINADYLRNSNSITIQAAIDNIQVTIGAFNAIYQLEVTPLREMLLNPALLFNQSNVLKSQIDQDIAPEAKIEDLNIDQIKAVQEIYTKICFNKTDTTPNVSLIQGPPGTGKSVVIISLAMQIVYGLGAKFRDKKILICSQSNCAIDLLAGKLLEARGRIPVKKNRFTLVRFGIFEKMHSKVHPLSLNNLLEFERVKKLSHTLNPQFVSVSIWKDNLKRLEAEIKLLQNLSIVNFAMFAKLEEKKREMSMLQAAYKNALSTEEEHKICKNYLGLCNIVCTTLSSCVKLFQYIDYFDICIIDEATQCTEAWNLLPLKFGISSLVLVGDSQQLPATVLSKQAAEYGLTTSLFTRIESNVINDSNDSNVIFSLHVQYRMHPEICLFPNLYFYNSLLKNAENTLANTTPLMPFSIFNLDFTESNSGSQGRIIHQIEADFVAELLKTLNEYIPIENNTYGVITPYGHQRQILADSVQNARLPHVTVNTIDSYQGVEKDVIVISNARKNGVGFLANPQRLNVAITRPKKCLILFGNFRNLQHVPAWRCLITNAQQRNVYYEISALDKRDIKMKVIQRILLQN